METTTNANLRAKSARPIAGQRTAIGVETQLSDCLATQRLAWAYGTVKNYVIVAIDLGSLPIPLFNFAALIANQLKMLHSVHTRYEVPFRMDINETIISTPIGSSIPVLSVIGLSSFAELIPRIGSLTGSAGVSVLSGGLTYAVGRVFLSSISSPATRY